MYNQDLPSMGWHKVHRKILNWELYKDVYASRLFYHLLLIANYEEKIWKGITIEKGQMISSVKRLSTDTGLTVKNVRTGLNKLSASGVITVKTTNKFSIITVCNYQEHQEKRLK